MGSFLVLDAGGIHVDTARKLGFEGHDVYYWNPWQSAYPQFQDYAPGFGASKITKVLDYAPFIDKVDCIVVPDIGLGGLTTWLRDKGYNVFGAGVAEKMEFDRKFSCETMDKYGLKYPKTHYATGLDEALKVLEKIGVPLKVDDKNETNQLLKGKAFVKFDVWRGDLETFPAASIEEAKRMFDKMRGSIGPYSESIPVCIQEMVEGVESGADLFFNGQEFVKPYMIGWESGGDYVGKVTNDLGIYEKDLDKVADLFRKMNYRGAFSTEAIYDGKDLHWIDWTCFDKETEVLTKDGWKFWPDVVQNDELCCLNPNGDQIFFEKPRGLISYPFNDDMVLIESDSSKRKLSVCVTPNHQMYVRRQGHTDYEFVRADQVTHGSKIPRLGNWQGIDYDTYTIKGFSNTWVSGRNESVERTHTYEDKIVKASSWFKFLALFLSEGSCCNPYNGMTKQILISQTKYVEEFEEIIQELEIQYQKTEQGFLIYHPGISTELHKFGTQEKRFIPDYVKNSSPRLINEFLNAYCLGDGSFADNGARVYYSTSKKLIDDLQELLLKVGSVGGITLKETKGTIAEINGKSYIRNHNIYHLHEKLQKKEYIIEKGNIKRVPYNDYVYCAEVSTHIMYVRRGGEPYWCGNCRFPMPLGMLYSVYADQLGNLFYDVAKKKSTTTQLPENNFIGCSMISSEEAANTYVSIKGNPTTRWMRFMEQGGTKYAVPGTSMLGIIPGKGRTLEDLDKDVRKNAEGVETFFGGYNLNFVNDVKEKYLNPFKEQFGIEFSPDYVDTPESYAKRLIREARCNRFIK